MAGRVQADVHRQRIGERGQPRPLVDLGGAVELVHRRLERQRRAAYVRALEQRRMRPAQCVARQRHVRAPCVPQRFIRQHAERFEHRTGTGEI
jgi:hypothetical protein